MQNKLKSAIRDRFPSTLIIKAWWVAIRDSFGKARETYSQTGEDKLVLKLIQDLKISSKVYVDVGANHPSRLSNTYRLYREGYSGVVIEPNRDLLRLHRAFRSRDLQFGIGCGDQSVVLPFKHATSHVLSGFESDGLKASSFKGTEFLPVLPLDLIVNGMNLDEIALLSIDVEGFDLHVLRGATETLKKTRILVIEGSESDEEIMSILSDAGFELSEKTIHNLIFTSNLEGSGS